MAFSEGGSTAADRLVEEVGKRQMRNDSQQKLAQAHKFWEKVARNMPLLEQAGAEDELRPKHIRTCGRIALEQQS